MTEAKSPETNQPIIQQVQPEDVNLLEEQSGKNIKERNKTGSQEYSGYYVEENGKIIHLTFLQDGQLTQEDYRNVSLSNALDGHGVFETTYPVVFEAWRLSGGGFDGATFENGIMVKGEDGYYNTWSMTPQADRFRSHHTGNETGIYYLGLNPLSNPNETATEDQRVSDELSEFGPEFILITHQKPGGEIQLTTLANLARSSNAVMPYIDDGSVGMDQLTLSICGDGCIVIEDAGQKPASGQEVDRKPSQFIFLFDNETEEWKFVDTQRSKQEESNNPDGTRTQTFQGVKNGVIYRESAGVDKDGNAFFTLSTFDPKTKEWKEKITQEDINNYNLITSYVPDGYDQPILEPADWFGSPGFWHTFTPEGDVVVIGKSDREGLYTVNIFSEQGRRTFFDGIKLNPDNFSPALLQLDFISRSKRGGVVHIFHYEQGFSSENDPGKIDSGQASHIFLLVDKNGQITREGTSKKFSPKTETMIGVDQQRAGLETSELTINFVKPDDPNGVPIQKDVIVILNKIAGSKIAKGDRLANQNKQKTDISTLSKITESHIRNPKTMSTEAHRQAKLQKRLSAS